MQKNGRAHKSPELNGQERSPRKSWRAFSTATAATSSVALGTLLFLPAFVAAQVVINEIMYNPDGSDSGREWVELYNEGSADVSIVGGTAKGSWRIFDGSNHTLIDPTSGVGRGTLRIPAGGYLVVAKDPASFIGEYPNGSYAVIKSSLSLNNTAATIALIDGSGKKLDSVAYEKAAGASDDGTSLQLTSSGSWIAALPTPGAANASAAYVPPAPKDVAPTKIAAPKSTQKMSRAGKSAQSASASAPAAAKPLGAPQGQAAAPIVLTRSAAASSMAAGSWWWLAALALAALGSVALVLSRRKAQTEWNIIEQTEE